MSRRGTPQILAFVAVGVVFVYGFYSYNELKSALRRSGESLKRSKLDYENLSTQLLAANEEKARLQSDMESNRKKYESSKEDLLRSKADQDARFKREKKEMADRYEQLNGEMKQVKESHENAERELRRHETLDAQHDNERAELKQSKQESDNEIAVLRDETANLKRQLKAIKKQLADQQLPESKKSLPGGKHVEDAANALNDKIDNRIHPLGPALHEGAENEVRMQINKPDDHERKPYFEPREAKPDHPVMKHGAPAVAAVNQVAPPDIENELDGPVAKAGRPLKFDANGKLHVPGGFDQHPMLPDERPENDRDNRLQANEPDFGKLDRFPHMAGNDFPGGDMNGQVEKPMQIVEPQRHQDEENQLPNPRNDDDNADEKEDDGNADDDDADYQYGGGEQKPAGRNANHDGPHAAPFEAEEDENDKEGGL